MSALAPEITSDGLESLLRHPAIWRGRSAAQVSVVPSGFPALDAALPGGGWPSAGLIEILVSHLGVGELNVLLPALAAHTQKTTTHRNARETPPNKPNTPTLAA